MLNTILASAKAPMDGPFYDAASETNFAALLSRLDSGDSAAILGAGVSAGAGIPTWPDFYQRLCDVTAAACGPAPRIFQPDLALPDLNTRRASLDATIYLDLLKEIFSQPVRRWPEIYQLIAHTFDLIATTNYDNYLYTMALLNSTRTDVRIYPDLPAGYHYYYLHGHAQSATDIHELVVCEQDYDLAYATDSGYALEVLLQIVRHHTAVFLGSSMSDPYMMRTLARLEALRRQTEPYGGRFELLQDRPCFAILPANPRDATVPATELLQSAVDRNVLVAEALSIHVEIRTAQLSHAGVKAIWYVHDGPHSNLLVLLRRLRLARGPNPRPTGGAMFLKSAELLDELGSIDDPTELQRNQAIDLIRAAPQYRTYFYRHATSPAWFHILDAEGLLEPETPRADDSGNVQVARWDAAPYIRRIARLQPKAFVDWAREFRTSNWDAVATLTDAVLDVPTELLELLLPAIRAWMSSSYSSLGISEHNCIHLLQRVVHDGNGRLAVDLLESIIQVSIDNDRESSHAAVMLTVDVAQLVVEVAALSPDATCEILRAFLLEVKGTSESDRRSTWAIRRPSIADSRQNIPGRTILDFLISALRDSLRVLATMSPKTAESILGQMLNGTDPVLRRLALHTITVVPTLLPSVENDLFQGHSLFDVDAFHENMVLLNRHFEQLTPRTKQRIRRAITEGPEGAVGETAEAARERRDHWAWRILSVLPNAMLTRAQRTLLSGLRAQWGEPEEPYFLAYSRPFTYRSPASVDELADVAAEGSQALLDVVRHPAARFAVTHDVSAPLVWEALAELVKRDPSRYLGLAAMLEIGDFETGEAWRYFQAYADLASSGVALEWSPLVQACLRLATASAAAGAPGRQAAWAVARLLRDAVSGGWGIGPGEFPTILDALTRIAGVYGTPLEENILKAPGGRLLDNQLNEPGGIAAEGIVLLAWRDRAVLRQAATLTPDSGTPELHREIKDVLDMGLRSAFGGIELRIAIGQFIALLNEAYPRFVDEYYDLLLPNGDGTSDRNSAIGFWVGYLSANHVYSELLLSLSSRYESWMAIVLSDDGIFEGFVRQRFIEHLAIGALRGLDGFGLDGLLGRFAESATEPALEHMAWYFGRALAESKGADDNDWERRVIEVADSYWSHRFSKLDSELATGEKSREVTSFVAWLEDYPGSLANIYDRLLFAIDHVGTGHSFTELASYLTRNVAAGVSRVATAAERIAFQWASRSDLVWSGNGLKPLLQAVLNAGAEAERLMVERVVNLLLRDLDVDFRDILADDGRAT